MSAFSKAEYAARLARVKASMGEAGADVLVLADPASLNYLTGYDGWSFYVHQYVVVIGDREQPLWIGRGMDAPGARLTSWLDEDSLVAYPESHVDSETLHPAAFVAGELLRRKLGSARIGVEMDSWYYTAQAHAELVAGLPSARFVNAHRLVGWARIVKSPAEIAMMRGAADIVSEAMKVGIAAVAPGVRECDAVAEIMAAQVHGTAGFWGDYPAALPSVPSGAKSAAPHLTWSGDRYEHDSVAYLELGGCHNRYHAALARTVYLGRPPDHLLTLAAVVEEGLETALEAARAGVTCEEVEAAWRAVITRAGYEKASRIGYSIGLNYPPDWGERTASLREGDRTVLRPDMCFHMILGMWEDDRGFELSETFRVTEDGSPEVMTRFPRDLVVKA
ncbi:M24 family metallopeptidase [Bauldia litoralis]|uniref:M24 family metallopeptidase n=1 Tax=Bauldia litoralis TaxID=665467 RepID=UPI003267AA5C